MGVSRAGWVSARGERGAFSGRRLCAFAWRVGSAHLAPRERVLHEQRVERALLEGGDLDDEGERDGGVEVAEREGVEDHVGAEARALGGDAAVLYVCIDRVETVGVSLSGCYPQQMEG